MRCTAGKETPLGVTGDHDWVLVKKVDDYFHQDGKRTLQLLWACPCGEFKWTSYAEWDGREQRHEMAVASVGGLEKWEAEHGFGQVDPTKERP